MKNDKSKVSESQLLDLLKRVLPKATADSQLAGKIYKAVEHELKAKGRATAFNKYCARTAIADFDAKSVGEVKQFLAAAFGEGDVTLKPNRKDKCLAVEVTLTDGSQFRGEIKVDPEAAARQAEEASGGDGEQEITFKFVPFPVCLPGDKELVWILAKRENMTPDEAGIALTKIEEEFWASKMGQRLIRDRVERSFPEFVARVPAKMLSELGLKRHYKTPEAVKLLRPLLKK